MKGRKLTPKQANFVRAYLTNGFNATEAAKSAGYSEKTAHSQGPRLLENVEVQKELGKYHQKAETKVDVTQDMILNELRKIAFADLRRATSWDDNGVSMIASDELDDDTAGAIQEVSEKSSMTQFGHSKQVKIKMYDKQRALELLGKHLGMFADRLKVEPDEKFHDVVMKILHG